MSHRTFVAAGGEGGPQLARESDERAWGLMPVSLYRAAVDKALARDWQPRFARLGIDARAAWTRSG